MAPEENTVEPVDSLAQQETSDNALTEATNTPSAETTAPASNDQTQTVATSDLATANQANSKAAKNLLLLI